MQNPLIQDSPNQNFSDFEKEALGEMVLKSVQSDLQQYLDRFHHQQIKDLEEKMVSFEKRCAEEIQDAIAKNIKIQLDAHFKSVVQACQKEISQATSPLFKRAERDVQNLAHTITKAQEFCKDIQAQYAFKWDKPFFTLFCATVFTGAVMGLFLLLLQMPFVSVFLMNSQTREAYEAGLSLLTYRKELEAQAKALESQPVREEPVAQKAPTMPSKKKKKKSK